MTSQTSTTDPPVSEREVFGWRFIGPLLIGSTLNPINSAMVATALVGIGIDFDKGPSTTALLVSVLYLCSAIMQPTMGKLSQVFGNRRIFVIGVSILLVAGVVGAVAQAFWMVVLSRGLIGVGTSAAYPTAMSMVRKRADAHGVGVPSRVIANFSVAAQVSSVVGLPLGGLLAGTFGWRAVFFVNVPWALITLALTFVGVAKDPPRPRRTEPLISSIDLAGIVLFAGTVTCFLLLVSGTPAPWWALLAGSAVLGALPIWWERRAAHPMIDVRMLAKNRGLLRTYVRQTTVALAVYTTMYGTTQWMEGSAGYDTTEVGLILLPLSGFSIVAAKIASRRGWIRWPLITAAVALLLTGLLMLTLGHSSPVALLVTMTLLFGIANGSSGFANQASLYMLAPPDELAVASGLFRTFNYLGAIFSSGLIALAYGGTTSDQGLHAVGWVVITLGTAFGALVLLDRRIPVSTDG